MCIIALSPAGVDLPDEEDIKYMFKRNPDGAGFAIQGDLDGNGGFKVRYQKGFMNVDDFLEALGPRDKLKDLTVAMHFRIKTHGNVDQGTTHPFPLSNQYNDLRKTEGEGAVLFHNGTFSGLGGKVDPNSSDTQDFVVGVAMRYLNNARMPGAVSQAVVEQIAGLCRILILYPKANFPMLKFGTWYEYKGNFYSNMGYRDTTPISNSGAYYSGGTFNYEHKSRKSTQLEELDEWGCNIAEFAYPDEIGWIRCGSKERFEKVLSLAKSRMTNTDGIVEYTFYRTGDTVWYTNEEKYELYTEDRMEDVWLRMDEESYMEQYGYYGNDDYIQFGDEDELIEWMDTCKRISTYEVIFCKKKWYVDTVNLEAYTDKGIAKLFKTGEQGHVKNQLKKTGVILTHKRQSAFPIDDDEDDVSAFMPVPYEGEEE